MALDERDMKILTIAYAKRGKQYKNRQILPARDSRVKQNWFCSLTCDLKDRIWDECGVIKEVWICDADNQIQFERAILFITSKFQQQAADRELKAHSKSQIWPPRRKHMNQNAKYSWTAVWTKGWKGPVNSVPISSTSPELSLMGSDPDARARSKIITASKMKEHGATNKSQQRRRRQTTVGVEDGGAGEGGGRGYGGHMAAVWEPFLLLFPQTPLPPNLPAHN